MILRRWSQPLYRGRQQPAFNRPSPAPTNHLSWRRCAHATCFIPGPEGLYCPPGDFFIDPVRPVDAGADHARPFRPCALRPRLGAGDAADARHHGAALRRGFCRRHAGGRYSARRSTSTASRVTFHPAGHVLGSAQIAVEHDGTAHRRLGRLQAAARPDLRCPSSRSTATSSSPRRPSACRCSAIPPTGDEIARLLQIGRAVSRARASRRRLCARQGAARHPADARRRLRQADLHPRRAGAGSATTTRARASISATSSRRRSRAARKAISPARSSSARPRPSPTAGRGAFPTRSSCFASGWMRIRQRAKQGGVELPLIISDHSDWDELTDTIRRDRRRRRSG